MATLNLLSHSPFGSDTFASCLRLLGQDDAIVLSGDAVYALRAATEPRRALEGLPSAIGLFALEEDLQARGLTNVPQGLVVLDYPGFVDVSLRYTKVNSWL
ncbi:sulfurtransferase complex subunit TusB [Pseudomonas sp. RIT-PI-AD]|uniref:sulfurtransferase complex subunit TusB n=1 Tax=Pseudomonas sp. RIT-PI-AD TaxID=3035294 RepID=UPI0021D915F5|nr:sulfurtransferase complex subunit TusB [Pseudomonas sp. RIT-PI-AD]